MLRVATQLVLAMMLFVVTAFSVPRAGEADPKNDSPGEGDWQVEHNPAQEKIKGPFNVKAVLAVSGSRTILFPTAPSPFVAVTPEADTDRDKLRVYDLRQMKPAGVTLQGKFKPASFRKWVLSPDGTLLAGSLFGDKPTVEVWSFTTGQMIQRMEVDTGAKIHVGMLDFLGPGELILMKHEFESPDGHDKATYQVWNIKTGKMLREFSEHLVFHPNWGTLTPGRKYLIMEHQATLSGYHICAWDLGTGKSAGKFEFQGKKEPFGQAAGLAVSPDGVELAMLYRMGEKPNRWGRILVFDFYSRKKLLDHPVNYDLERIDSLWESGGYTTIQYWPQRRGWLLFGHLLIDRDSGAVVYKVPPAPTWHGDMVERRFLDPDHITHAEKTIGIGKFDRKISVIALPRDQINAAVKKAREPAKPGM